MKFLTFDTSLDKTYVTLFENEETLASKTIENHDDKYHSAFLIAEIAEILKANSLKMQDIEAIGVNAGPGSFTGIRACITIARVIAQQLEVPVVSISSLEILSKLNETTLPSLVLMDARKNMCYFAEYDKIENGGKELQSAHLESLETLCADDKTHKIITDEVMKNFLKEKGVKSTCYTDKNADLGRLLGLLTHQKLTSGKSFNWAEAKPIYLQTPSISTPKKSLI